MLKERHSDIIIHRLSIDYDTLTYIIPPNYKIESIHEENKTSSVFGDYSTTIQAQENKIILLENLRSIKVVIKRQSINFFTNIISLFQNQIM